MPSFAELRDRAAKARDTGLTKLSDTRDRYSSRSSKDIDWTVDHSRSASASSISQPAAPAPNYARARPAPPPKPPVRHDAPPPLIRNNSRPDRSPAYSPSPPSPSPAAAVPARPSPPSYARAPAQASSDKIDWAHLSTKDKEVFFSWLDEFFERQLNIKIPPRKSAPTVQVSSRPVTPLKAPAVNMSSRPSPLSQTSSEDYMANFTLSYPPPSAHGSAALDLALYFSPSAHWDTAWYASTNSLAPPLQQAAESPTWTASWSTRGTTKTIYAGVLFSDLSMCWYTVSFSTAPSSSSDPNDTQAVTRSARYLPRPSAQQDRAALVAASETYGEAVAAYAESFEGTGQYCARGECWDLANEALKYFSEQYPDTVLPRPVQSIGRTHGHLVFEGKAAQNGSVQVGRWRGGDDRIRRGDIVEWRSVRVGMGPHGYAMLGSPDHTAVIVSDTVPAVRVADGRGVRLSEMGTLEVVEQSVGKPPKRERYDLGQMQEGEVWVYRPIGMKEYVGAVLGPQCPEDVNALSV